MKKLKVLIIVISALILASAATLAINTAMNKTVKLTQYTFHHNDIPYNFDGYKIFLISDQHEAPFADQILAHIEDTRPDVIIFCGDMVQLPGYSFEETKKIAEGVGDTIPMYAVSGNHESQNEEYEHIIGNLWDAGIVWLENDSKRIKRDGDIIWLIGAKDSGKNELREEEVQEDVISKIEGLIPEDSGEFSILINHRADMYPYLKNIGVDLILSGHMHGGIIRLPFLGGVIGHDIYDSSIFPAYDYGFFSEGAAAMIVSGGCDQNVSKKRYFNQPEVVLITLDK